jgi:hypothetical protein
MKNYILISIVILVFHSCSKKGQIQQIESTPLPPNARVLTLQVDYLSNVFEGGWEDTFSTNSQTFTISNLYKSPSDFGYVSLKYHEINEVIFVGSIIWMGSGQISYPINITPANQFNTVSSNDTINPSAGFENVFNPNNQLFDYIPIWNSIQQLEKVRSYMNNNPNATIKLFLYTPSVGFGNPAEWNWFVFLKN